MTTKKKPASHEDFQAALTAAEQSLKDLRQEYIQWQKDNPEKLRKQATLEEIQAIQRKQREKVPAEQLAEEAKRANQLAAMQNTKK